MLPELNLGGQSSCTQDESAGAQPSRAPVLLEDDLQPELDLPLGG
jgi:hypothetical protein